MVPFTYGSKRPAMMRQAFVEQAIAHNVLIIPGNVFSERDSHFRVCYTVPDDQLRAGAETLLSLAIVTSGDHILIKMKTIING